MYSAQLANWWQQDKMPQWKQRMAAPLLETQNLKQFRVQKVRWWLNLGQIHSKQSLTTTHCSVQMHEWLLSLTVMTFYCCFLWLFCYCFLLYLSKAHIRSSCSALVGGSIKYILTYLHTISLNRLKPFVSYIHCSYQNQDPHWITLYYKYIWSLQSIKTPTA